MTDTNDLDLVIERRLNAPRDLIWKAWSDPNELAKWWCPKPWQADVVEFDLKPGGAFHISMRGSDGEAFDNPGAFLDVQPKERIVFTSSLKAGWRPVLQDSFPMTAIITMQDDTGGTRYTARVLHADADGRKQHEEMGFFEGWGACIDQLESLAKELEGTSL